MVVGLLGILKAGGLTCLRPSHPPERLAFMLSDAQVMVVLAQAQVVESLPEHACGLPRQIGAIAQHSVQIPGMCLNQLT